MSVKLRYACIGAGGIADKKHLSDYSKIQKVELVAICDIQFQAAERLAKKYGISKVYTDYLEMFKAEALDIVSICLPNYLHAPITIAALEHGIHVHCEKPLALNSQEIQTIIDARNQNNKMVMVALNNRFTKEANFVKKCIEEGSLGEIYHAKCGWRRRNGIPGKGVWFTDKSKSGGGALIDLGVHYLDLVLYYMGYPQVDTVFGATYAKFGHTDNRLRPGYKNHGDGKFDVEDMAVGMIRMTNGATVDFDFSWAENIEQETKYYELMGTLGGLSYVNGVLKLFTESGGTSVNVIPDLSLAPPVMNEFEHFVSSIEQGTEPSSSAEQSLSLMQIIEKVYDLNALL